MVKFVDKVNVKQYGRFFLSTEAPGDPGEPPADAPAADAYAPAGNTRVINVLPGDRTRRLNFEDPDDAPAPIPAPPDPNPVADPTEPTVADNNPGVTGAPAGALPPIDPTAPPAPMPAAAPPPVDAGAPPQGGDEAVPPDEGGDGPDVDDGGDALNFSDDANTSGDMVDSTPPSEDGGNDDQNQGYGIEVDSMRRFQLFENFIALYESIDGFIDKLENTLSDDARQNQAVMIVYKKMKKIKELIHDYMMLFFESSTYVQSLMFYQTMYVAVLKNFDTLERVKKIIKKDPAMQHS